MKKLKEIRQRKENIVNLLVENEKRKQEKEALQEKTKKLMEFSARRIQGIWKKYKKTKAFQQFQHMKRIEALNQIDLKVQYLIGKLKNRLNLEKEKLIKVIFLFCKLN